MKELIAKYREKGFKLTPQRLAILDFLEGNTDHPAAEDIYRHLRAVYPTVSFATVYNTLQALKVKGEIIEVTIDPQKKHYDPNTEPHHHIICVRCNKISDIFKDYSEALRLPYHIKGEFQSTANHVNFYGICKKCRNLSRCVSKREIKKRRN